MADIQHVTFDLDLDEPDDKQIWERLRPLIARGESNALLRGAAMQALGLIGHAPSWGLGYAYSVGDLANTDSTQDVLSRNLANSEEWCLSVTMTPTKET